jgi:hypothetical protein
MKPYRFYDKQTGVKIATHKQQFKDLPISVRKAFARGSVI